MHRYQFVGVAETVLTGLVNGVNAVLHREGHGQPDGSTVVAQPGDEVTTAEAYPHAHMVDSSSGENHVPDVADLAAAPDPQEVLAAAAAASSVPAVPVPAVEQHQAPPLSDVLPAGQQGLELAHLAPLPVTTEGAPAEQHADDGQPAGSPAEGQE